MNDGCDTIGAENEIDILRCRILFSIDLVLFLNEEFTVTAATLWTAQQFHVDVHFVQFFRHGLLFYLLIT